MEITVQRYSDEGFKGLTGQGLHASYKKEGNVITLQRSGYGHIFVSLILGFFALIGLYFILTESLDSTETVVVYGIVGVTLLLSVLYVHTWFFQKPLIILDLDKKTGIELRGKKVVKSVDLNSLSDFEVVHRGINPGVPDNNMSYYTLQAKQDGNLFTICASDTNTLEELKEILS